MYYYPQLSGNFTYPAGAPADLVGFTTKFEQSFMKYQIGGTYNLGSTGLFIDAGFLGDRISQRQLSPGDASHSGGYAGLGFHF